MSVPIVPAFIPKSRADVISATVEFRFSHEIHLDVVDGIFVPNTSWPFSPHDEPVAVRQYTDGYTLEVDLMVKNPIKPARQWEEAGADMLVFHCETIDLVSFVDFVAHSCATIGVSFHGDTSLETFLPYAEVADYVQIMGIRQIGAQGQKFDERVFEYIKKIKEILPDKMISVDGSVNLSTASRLGQAGVDRLIVGSAITLATDKQQAYESLVKTVNS